MEHQRYIVIIPTRTGRAFRRACDRNRADVKRRKLMTIHHDKMAYGKLAATAEEMSEEALLKMLNELNCAEDDCESPRKKVDEREQMRKDD